MRLLYCLTCQTSIQLEITMKRCPHCGKCEGRIIDETITETYGKCEVIRISDASFEEASRLQKKDSLIAAHFTAWLEREANIYSLEEHGYSRGEKE